MANYKLTNDYWETSGVYDITQGKTQREINADLKVSAESTIKPETVSGSVATFEGGEGVPLKNLTVNIEPAQDLHGQAYPYPAGGMGNLFGPNANPMSGYYVSANGGTISADGWNASDYIAVKPSTQYTFSLDTTSGSSAKHAFYTDEKEAISGTSIASGSGTFTTPSNCYYMRFSYRSETTWIQLELGSSATTYHPYSNICPITGWTGANVTRTGVNVWDEEWELGAFDDATGEPFSASAIRSKNYIPVKPDETLRFINGGVSVYAKFVYYDASKNVVQVVTNTISNNKTFKIPSGVFYVRFNMGSQYGTTYNNNISINYPSTDTDYHAYTGTTYSITFPAGAGTVYGGTLDVTNGVLTVDREMWSGTIADGTVQVTSDNYIRYQFYPTITHSPNQAGISTGKISNLGKYYYADVYTYPHWYNNAYGTVQLFVPESVESSTPVQFVISLATPITYTLTPTEVKALLGQNNIWADCGDVDVEYGAYLTVVENQLGEKIPKVAVAPIEKTTTASKAYDVNEMFFMGDKLYIVTDDIASGGTITVGTNCDETTLGEQIAALLNA